MEGISSRNTRKDVYAGPVLVAGISGRIGLMIALLMSLQQAKAQKTQANSTGNCHVGTYRLSDGSDVDVGPDDEYLQWRMKDGTTGELAATTDGNWFSTLGMTRRPDGKRVSFGDCDVLIHPALDCKILNELPLERGIDLKVKTTSGQAQYPRWRFTIDVVVA